MSRQGDLLRWQSKKQEREIREVEGFKSLPSTKTTDGKIVKNIEFEGIPENQEILYTGDYICWKEFESPYVYFIYLPVEKDNKSKRNFFLPALTTGKFPSL